MTRGICIAIDGPASSGKGTVARAVAQVLGYTYVDTGAMYRAVGLLAGEQRTPLDAQRALTEIAASLDLRFTWTGERLRVSIGGRDITDAIRAEAVGNAASAVAAIPSVRAALLDVQRRMGSAGGVVMDGRDIGTVILPNAQLKVFLDASVAERAKRRHAELIGRGQDIDLATVQAELVARDSQDSERAVAPLAAAHDAVVLDSTHLSPAEVVAAVVQLAHERGA